MKQNKTPGWVGLMVSLTGVALMVFGACRGEMATVLKKAINICLECIGIG